MSDLPFRQWLQPIYGVEVDGVVDGVCGGFGPEGVSWDFCFISFMILISSELSKVGEKAFTCLSFLVLIFLEKKK